MLKWPKKALFTALTLQMTVISSVVLDAIRAKNVVRKVTRFDIMEIDQIGHCVIILASYNIVN